MKDYEAKHFFLSTRLRKGVALNIFQKLHFFFENAGSFSFIRFNVCTAADLLQLALDLICDLCILTPHLYCKRAMQHDSTVSFIIMGVF